MLLKKTLLFTIVTMTIVFTEQAFAGKVPLHLSNQDNLGIGGSSYPNAKVRIFAKPIPCEASATMFSGQPTKMNLMDLISGKITSVKANLKTAELNAAGYNKKDGYIWGVDQNSADGTLIRIGLDKNNKYVGKKFKIRGESFDSYVGDVDNNGHLYIKVGDVNSLKIIVIDLDPDSSTYLTKIKSFSLTQKLAIHDWAFNPKDNFLYAVSKGKAHRKGYNILYKINPKNGTVTSLGNTKMNEKQNIGAAFFDKDANLYVYANKSGKIYRINVASSAIAKPFSTTNIVSRNDGAMCSDIEIDSPLSGVFNIERTNSDRYAINSDARNAWYTQITGRDFNYAVLLYNEDFTDIQVTEKVTFKVELHNNENNSTVTQMEAYYGYFSPILSTHKIPITASHDLDKLPALKDVSFKISYAVQPDNSLVQEECLSGNYQQCYETLASKYTIKEELARDNFAIRPSHFYMEIMDEGNSLKDNKVSNSTALRLASGYDYKLGIKAMTTDNKSVAKKYTTFELNQQVLFKDNKDKCLKQEDYTTNQSIKNGKILSTFSNPEVGKYLLHLEDKTWTKVDWENNKKDCKLSDSSISRATGSTHEGDIPSGCNIVSNNDISLAYYPYKFDLSTIKFNVLPIDEFNTIYMSKINTNSNDVSIQLKGKIIAQNKQGERTVNFTSSCAAEDISVSLDVNITSDNGLNQNLQTTTDIDGNRRDVFFNRLKSINNLPFSLKPIKNLDSPIHINKTSFLDNDLSLAGEVNIDLRYNIDKTITQPINPISVNFQAIHTDSIDAQSNTEEINSFVPKGEAILNSLRYFYFARVKPFHYNYPRVIYSGKDVNINTPLSVEIFCDFSEAYCNEMQVFKNTNIYASPNRQNGWYIAINHNQNLDGNIISLNSLSNGLSINPINNITFIKGQSIPITSTITNGDNSINQVDVIVPPQLKYNPDATRNGNPQYVVPQSNTSPSEWTGVGEVGHTVGIEANTNNSKKVSW